ncbi:hypothetical protein EUX98_g9428 [Antrodiella citrinella]|uniref:C2H2-type domain-containing protein n=1 Tax=Antrodiella citrinella TaxID=2447956 RepID=A0A4S4LTC7_9APHY|nr:hypothetical protein EUX98_g9428 [Antrodiella citrinella]
MPFSAARQPPPKSKPLWCKLCNITFKNLSGFTKHNNTIHLPLAGHLPSKHLPSTASGSLRTNNVPDNNVFHDLQDAFDSVLEGDPSEPSEEEEIPHMNAKLRRETHPYMNGCHTNAAGEVIPQDVPPLPYSSKCKDDWTPYDSRLQFEMVEFLFKRQQMSGPNVNWLMDAFAAFGYGFGAAPPFKDTTHMHNTVDSTPLGDALWSSFTAQYTGEMPETNIPA